MRFDIEAPWHVYGSALVVLLYVRLRRSRWCGALLAVMKAEVEGSKVVELATVGYARSHCVRRLKSRLFAQ